VFKNSESRNSRSNQGQSLIELAIILPLLLLLALGIVDFARAIQFNNILVAMSREGANLAARTSDTHQDIIRAINSTAEPLLMDAHGMMYITRILGTKVGGSVEARVQSQTRAVTGNKTLISDVWGNCDSWDLSNGVNRGSCLTIPVGTKAKLNMVLSDGDDVYAVEVFYDYQVIVSYVMKSNPKLYSLTVL